MVRRAPAQHAPAMPFSRSTTLRRALSAFAIVALFIAACGETSTVGSVDAEGYVDAEQRPVLGAEGPGVPSPEGGTGTRNIRPLNGSQCDVCDAIRGVDNCGNPCGGAAEPSCGTPGQCPCSFADYTLIGLCASRPPSSACTFCPPGTRSSDPCSEQCEIVDEKEAPPPTRTRCPSSHPVSCGASKTCCPSSHSACCPGGSVCGASSADCSDEPWYARQRDDGASGAGRSTPSPGTGSGCGVACTGGLQSAKLRPGCCQGSVCPSSCADGCGNSWYEVKGGLYGPCATRDVACLQNVAAQAVKACR